MKKTFIAACIAASLGIAGFNAFETIETAKLSDLALKNIEALADGESVSSNNCPDFNYVPNHYLEVVLGTVSVKSDREGNISIGDVVYGGYKKNTEYNIPVEIKNCSGIQEGACCDQREIGITIV